MSDTRAELYAAICADPHDVTLRLAFADYLEGLDPVRVRCVKCKGKGTMLAYPECFEDPPPTPHMCPWCDGTGRGEDLDRADPDLAEYIRVQCELAKAPLVCHCFMYRCDEAFGASEEVGCFKDRNRHARRERELEKAHPEWKRVKCADCDDGTQGKKNGHDRLACRTCGGTGDLFEFCNVGTSTAAGVRSCVVVNRGGFPWEVGCRWSDLMVLKPCPHCHPDRPGWQHSAYPGGWEMCLQCDGRGHVPVHPFQPSAWLSEVVRWSPVARFVAGDVPIFPSGGNSTHYVGSLGSFPREYWARLDNHPTRKAAVDALADVIGEWARASLPTR